MDPSGTAALLVLDVAGAQAAVEQVCPGGGAPRA
jgi:hypothetical protein